MYLILEKKHETTISHAAFDFILIPTPIIEHLPLPRLHLLP